MTCPWSLGCLMTCQNASPRRPRRSHAPRPLTKGSVPPPPVRATHQGQEAQPGSPHSTPTAFLHLGTRDPLGWAVLHGAVPCPEGHSAASLADSRCQKTPHPILSQPKYLQTSPSVSWKREWGAKSPPFEKRCTK